MECVIFCGGKGLRMGELGNEIPKCLMNVGHKPILEHIMNHYANYGVKKFILCMGYLGNRISEYFAKNPSKYEVHLVDTGLESTKAERLKMIKDFVGETFFVSYGDDISNINIHKLLELHKREGKIATLTTVHLHNPYGVLELDEFSPHLVNKFHEKPLMKEWVNGGYFVFNKEIFDYIEDGDDLEKEVFAKLTKQQSLSAYRHPGLWKSMNTPKEMNELDKMFEKGEFAGLSKAQESQNDR